MKKKDISLSDLSDLRSIFGLSESVPEETLNTIDSEDEKALPKQLQASVRIHLQRLKGNREATLIKGLQDTDKVLDELCTTLKKICGVGGSLKHGEIIIQGNQREKVKKYLQDAGYKDVKIAGG